MGRCLEGREKSGSGAMRDVEFTRRGSLNVVTCNLFDF